MAFYMKMIIRMKIKGVPWCKGQTLVRTWKVNSTGKCVTMAKTGGHVLHHLVPSLSSVVRLLGRETTLCDFFQNLVFITRSNTKLALRMTCLQLLRYDAFMFSKCSSLTMKAATCIRFPIYMNFFTFNITLSTRNQ